VSAAFEHRGLVEGFYGPPWPHPERLTWLERLGAWGMNRYVYAPKDDPLHRAEWRTPYPEAQRREHAELVERGAACGVAVGFAVSPGLSITCSSPADVGALQRKLRSFADLGAGFLSLALDDVPARLVHEADRRTFTGLADAHVALVEAVRDAVGSDVTLWLVPTDYLGVEETDYLAELGERLDPSVEVGWTGRTVVSPSVRADEARRRSATLRRRLLLWDNVPVADGPMRCMLHLGPYRGRDPGLSPHVSGVLLNPMQHPRASAAAVRTAADYLREPRAYDPEASWRAACDEVGAGASEAFRLFAAAHRFSALDPSDRDRELESAWRSVRDALLAEQPERAHEPLARLGALLEARAGAAETLRRDLADRALAAELEPWLEAHRTETTRMQAAAGLLERVLSRAEPLARALAAMGFEGRLTRLPLPPVSSFGPRRVLYPQLASMREEEARFAADPVLFEDRCLADEIVSAAGAWALERLGGRRETGGGPAADGPADTDPGD